MDFQSSLPCLLFLVISSKAKLRRAKSASKSAKNDQMVRWVFPRPSCTIFFFKRKKFHRKSIIKLKGKFSLTKLETKLNAQPGSWDLETISTIYGQEIDFWWNRKHENFFFLAFTTTTIIITTATNQKERNPFRLLYDCVSFDSSSEKIFRWAITQRANRKTILTQSIVRNKRFFMCTCIRANIIGIYCRFLPLTGYFFVDVVVSCRFARRKKKV